MFFFVFFIKYFDNSYFAIFLFFFISFILAFVLFLLPSLLAFRNSSVEKLSTYECGFEPFSDAHNIFDVHFVIVAILFLLFDFELLILYPFVLSYKFGLNYYGSFFIFNLIFFLLFLFLAFIYEWLTGALI